MFRSRGKALVRTVTSGRLPAVDAVRQAIDGRRHADLSSLMENADLLNAETRRTVYEHVIAARDVQCLQVMYSADRYSHSMSRARLRLLEQLHAVQWEEGLSLVIRRREEDSVDALADVLGMDMSAGVRDLLHEHHARWRMTTYLVYHACAHNPQQVAYFYSLAEKNAFKVDHNHALTELLSKGKSVEDIAPAVDFMLSKLGGGEDKKFPIMLKMLVLGMTAQAQAYIDAGFPFKQYGKKLYSDLKNAEAPEASLCYVRDLLDMPEVTGEYGGFTREGADSVSLTTTFTSGPTLTMVFNFATGQQILLLQEDKTLAPATAVPFSQLGNKDILARAATAFVKTGGDAALVADISDTARPALIGKPVVKGAG